MVSVLSDVLSDVRVCTPEAEQAIPRMYPNVDPQSSNSEHSRCSQDENRLEAPPVHHQHHTAHGEHDSESREVAGDVRHAGWLPADREVLEDLPDETP
jgi:hypothetical protein